MSIRLSVANSSCRHGQRERERVSDEDRQKRRTRCFHHHHHYSCSSSVAHSIEQRERKDIDLHQRCCYSNELMSRSRTSRLIEGSRWPSDSNCRCSASGYLQQIDLMSSNFFSAGQMTRSFFSTIASKVIRITHTRTDKGLREIRGDPVCSQNERTNERTNDQFSPTTKKTNSSE